MSTGTFHLNYCYLMREFIYVSILFLNNIFHTIYINIHKFSCEKFDTLVSPNSQRDIRGKGDIIRPPPRPSKAARTEVCFRGPWAYSGGGSISRTEQDFFSHFFYMYLRLPAPFPPAPICNWSQPPTIHIISLFSHTHKIHKNLLCSKNSYANK